jgi:hypothetical protein
MTRALLPLALVLACAAGCDEPLPVSPAGSPVPTRAPSLAASSPRAVATPARPGPVAPIATQTPVVPGARTPAPVQGLPTPATPGPVRSSTPRPLPSASGGGTAVELNFTPLDRVTGPGGMSYHPKAVRIRSSAALGSFFRQALAQPEGALFGVDFNTKEVLALHDPGTADPLTGCETPLLDKLLDLGPRLAFLYVPPRLLDGCGEPRQPGYTFYAIARTEKPIDGTVEHVVASPTPAPSASPSP